MERKDWEEVGGTQTSCRNDGAQWWHTARQMGWDNKLYDRESGYVPEFKHDGKPRRKRRNDNVNVANSWIGHSRSLAGGS